MKVEQLQTFLVLSIHRRTFEIKRRNTILCKTLSNERRTEESHTKRNG